MRIAIAITITVATLFVAACGSSDNTIEVGSDNSDDLPLGAGPYPIADLSFDIDLAGDGVTTRYRLACLGDTATFTGDSQDLDATAACLALRDDDVRLRLSFNQTDAASRACTEQYGGPEMAVISGTLDGEPVDTAIDRINGCGIADWVLLSELLPQPSGS